MNIEPAQLLETRECVSPESWEEAQRNFRGRWMWSMPALNIWQFDEFVSAYDVAPGAYRQLGLMQNRGNVVEVFDGEREAVLDLTVHATAFQPHYKTGSFSTSRAMLNLGRVVLQDIGRMAARIEAHVTASGTPWTGVRPTRTTEEDPHRMLAGKWIDQKGRCFLCNGPLCPDTKNYLLQSSCDRLDSADTAYNRENTHITHLGCNLAKNKVSLQEFEDWITVVRGELGEESEHAMKAAASSDA